MVYTAKFKKLQKKIFFPVNISVLASLGIHGVFFSFLLPKWDFTNPEDNGQSLSNTPVIELNQIEKTRLPDLSPRQFSNWNLISQLPSTNTDISEISPPSISSFQFPSINNNNISNLPPPPSVSPLPNYSYNIPSSFTLPPPPPLDSISPNIPTTIPPKIQKDLNDIAINQEQENIDIRQSLFPPQPTGEIESPRVLINSENNQSQNTPIASSPLNTNNNNLPNDDVALKSPSVKPSNYKVLTSMLQEDATNTSNEDATKNDLAWRQEVQVAKPEAINMSGIYPKDACIRKLEGNAAYGVTVNGQGQVTSTKLLKSAGLPIFNQQALRQIKSKSFQSTGKPKAYHVFVDFKPNNCPSLSLDNLGKIPPKKQPSASPKVEDTPKQEVNSPPPEKKVNPPVTPTNNSPSQKVETPTPNTPAPEKKVNPPVTPTNNNSSQRVESPTPNTPAPEKKVNPPVTPTNNNSSPKVESPTPNTPAPEKKVNPPVTPTNNSSSQKVESPTPNSPPPEKKVNPPVTPTNNSSSQKVESPTPNTPAPEKKVNPPVTP